MGIVPDHGVRGVDHYHRSRGGKGNHGYRASGGKGDRGPRASGEMGAPIQSGETWAPDKFGETWAPIQSGEDLDIGLVHGGKGAVRPEVLFDTTAN